MRGCFRNSKLRIQNYDKQVAVSSSRLSKECKHSLLSFRSVGSKLDFENRLKKKLSSAAAGGVARETRYAAEDTS